MPVAAAKTPPPHRHLFAAKERPPAPTRDEVVAPLFVPSTVSGPPSVGAVATHTILNTGDDGVPHRDCNHVNGAAQRDDGDTATASTTLTTAPTATP